MSVKLDCASFQDDSTQDEHDQCPEDLIDCLLDMDNDTERRRFLIVSLNYHSIKSYDYLNII